ncbi:helix-turn-helix domain-containing protein [Dyadobacter sp. BHUBP1]|uniref:helix-turn-helix domain-containing protein n=1 Tax=Dyadobacter sp. BHUBP1 TaxID=3424178 RepID=UPI003D3254F2
MKPKTIYHQRVQNYIHDARKFAKLSQKQLAKELGVNQSMISAWEKGVKTPFAAVVFRIMEVTHFRPDNF